MSYLVPAGTFQREIQTAQPNPASPGKGLGPVAMDALWQPEPRSSGMALGLSRGSRGSQSCDQTDISVQGPIWTPETWCRQEELTEIPGGRSRVYRWLAVTLTPSISPPFSRGREKVHSVLESGMLSHLPRFPSLILKHQLHFQGLSPQGFEMLLPAILGTQQLLTPPHRETSFASPMFSQARMVGPISSSFLKTFSFLEGWKRDILASCETRTIRRCENHLNLLHPGWTQVQFPLVQICIILRYHGNIPGPKTCWKPHSPECPGRAATLKSGG